MLGRERTVTQGLPIRGWGESRESLSPPAGSGSGAAVGPPARRVTFDLLGKTLIDFVRALPPSSRPVGAHPGEPRDTDRSAREMVSAIARGET